LTPSTGYSGVAADLARRIAAFVRSWGSAGRFETLALNLFRYQYVNNEPYRRFCDSRGAAPETVRSWTAIPAVPADAFRTQTLSCAPITAQNADAIFRTSGTTSNDSFGRGVHWMDTAALDLYRLSLRTGFTRLAARASHLPLVSLVAPFDAAPDSSLSFMLSTLAHDLEAAGNPARFCWRSEGPDFAAARQFLAYETGPVLLFTTALALLELIGSLEAPLRVHPDTIVIETGGSKGRRRMITREELYRMASDRLTLAPAQIGSEYGMCEMASQFYDEHLGRIEICGEGKLDSSDVKTGAPWVQSVLIDPDTGEEAAAGQPGILRHFDLCNLNSVMAIQTMDLAVLPSNRGRLEGSDPIDGAGPAGARRGFILQGRLSDAPARGCSLTVEEWLERTGGNH